jgi:hypothetical protein
MSSRQIPIAVDMAMLSKLWYFPLLDDGGRRHALADIALALLRSDYRPALSLSELSLLHAAAVGTNRAVQQGLLPSCPAAVESVRKGVEFFDSILKKLGE